MLAWVVYSKEGICNADALAARVTELCEPIMAAVLGERVTLAEITEQTFAEQGAWITPAQLLQRADKADRYLEFNDFKEPVEHAYASLRADDQGAGR